MNPKIMIAGGAVLLIGASIGATMFLLPGSGEVDPEVAAALAAEAAMPPETYYYTFQPEFIVNSSSESRTKYLMLDVAVSSLDEEMPDLLKKHAPEIRNDLLVLFSGSATDKLHKEEGKIALRGQVVERISAIVEKHHPNKKIVDVFFTRFVME